MPTNKLVEENRIGKFSVSRRLIFDSDDAALRALFGQTIIIRAGTDFQRYSVDYTAFSPLFTPLQRGSEPPWYKIWITVGADEKLSFSAEVVADHWEAAVEMPMSFGEISPN